MTSSCKRKTQKHLQIRNMKKILIKILLAPVVVVLLLLILYALFIAFQNPSLYRDWAEDQSILADISFDNNLVSIKNLGNYDYSSPSEYTSQYYDEEFDISLLERVWYIIEPFGEKDGPAHTMMSFDFSDGKHVAISAEIRKEK